MSDEPLPELVPCVICGKMIKGALMDPAICTRCACTPNTLCPLCGQGVVRSMDMEVPNIGVPPVYVHHQCWVRRRVNE